METGQVENLFTKQKIKDEIQRTKLDWKTANKAKNKRAHLVTKTIQTNDQLEKKDENQI